MLTSPAPIPLIAAGAMLLAVLIGPPCFAQDDESPPAEEDSSETPPEPTQHAESGVWMPGTLAGLQLEGSERLRGRRQGEKFAYANEDRFSALTVSAEVLSKNGAADPDAQAEGRIEEIVREIALLDLAGKYENVQTSPLSASTHQALEVPLRLLTLSLTYSYSSDITGDDALPVRSLIGVVPYQKHLFSFRYTEPVGRGGPFDDPDAAAAAAIAEFLGIFLENELHPGILERVALYRDTPFSVDGVAAGDFLMAYAEQSPLAFIRLSKELNTFLGGDPSHSDQDIAHTSALLRAYVIGNLAEQVENHDWGDKPEAGKKMTAHVYRILRDAEPDLKPRPEIEKLLD